MSLSRRNPKRDANEKAIVEALEARGARVFRLSGKGLPDLLTLYKGRWVPLEVKSATGRLTVAQRDGSMPVPVVRSVADALAAIGVTRG